jgi:hypothetical protein
MPTPALLRSVLRSVLGLAMLATAAIFLYAIELKEIMAIIVAPFFAAWTVAPYALLWWRTADRDTGKVEAGLLLLLATVVSAFGLSAYAQALLSPRTGAQAGMLFILIPLWQAAGVMLGVGASAWIGARLDRN